MSAYNELHSAYCLVYAELKMMKEALVNYAYHQPHDLIKPHQLQADLLAIAGVQTHVHRASISQDDRCALCNRDLRESIHERAKN